MSCIVCGAELHLDALVLRPHHRGVDRAIAVRLRQRDEVLEPLGDHLPGAVQDAERAVAVLLGADDGAEPEHVGELLEVDLLVLELAPDRERPLGAALDPRLDAGFGELALDLVGDAARCAARIARRAARSRFTIELARLRVELGKGQVFELLAHVLHADAAGERRVDFDRLLGDAASLVRRS